VTRPCRLDHAQGDEVRAQRRRHRSRERSGRRSRLGQVHRRDDVTKHDIVRPLRRDENRQAGAADGVQSGAAAHPAAQRRMVFAAQHDDVGPEFPGHVAQDDGGSAGADDQASDRVVRQVSRQGRGQLPSGRSAGWLHRVIGQVFVRECDPPFAHGVHWMAFAAHRLCEARAQRRGGGRLGRIIYPDEDLFPGHGSLPVADVVVSSP
jgi:hypothetical protein